MSSEGSETATIPDSGSVPTEALIPEGPSFAISLTALGKKPLEKSAARSKFVSPTDSKGNTAISPENRVLIGDADLELILVENKTLFDMNRIAMVVGSNLNQMADIGGLNPDLIAASFIAHVWTNGAARNVNTEGFNVSVRVKAPKDIPRNDFDVMYKEENGVHMVVLNFQRMLRNIEDEAKEQYKSGVSTDHSASGTKLATRVLANNFPIVMRKMTNGDVNLMKNMSKIAKKLQLVTKIDIALSTQAVPDWYYVSRNDGVRFMRIMSAYMKRTRDGKNKIGNDNKEVDKKAIFLSMCSRIVLVHKSLTGWDTSKSEEI